MLKQPSAEGQRDPRQQIGGRPRRLSSRERRHIRVESLGHAGHTEGGHRARPRHPGRLQTSEATPTPIQRGEAQGHRRGGIEAFGGRIRQGSVPSGVVS